jgi:uncharacterized protein YneF (UPF0154 family)
MAQKEVDIIGLLAGSIGFIKKYYILLSITLGVGILAGIADYYFTRNYYTTSLVASSPVINNQIVFELAKPLNYYIRSEMYDSVAIKLNVSEEVAKDIRKVSIDTSISMAVCFDLELYNKESITAVKEGLMYYFNSIPFVVSTIEQQRSEYKKFVDDIDKEIADLNALQEAVYKSISSEKSAGILSAGGMYNEIVTLYDKKIELIQEYNKLQKFKVVSGSMVFVPVKSLKKEIFIFGIIGLLTGILIGGFVDIKKSIQKRLKEKKSE